MVRPKVQNETPGSLRRKNRKYSNTCSVGDETFSIVSAPKRFLVHSAISMLVLPLLLVPFSHGQISFLIDPLPYVSGTGVTYLSDLNSDGNLDLVFGDGTVLLGKGDGTFNTGTAVSLPSGSTVMAVADLNGDGKPDLVSMNGFNLLVFLGKGDGTFQSPASTYVAASYSPVVVADANGDGKLDVIGVNSSAVLAVFLGKGDGTFSVGNTYSVPASYAMVAEDFNGDHKIDLALAANGNVVVLLGNGDGSFQSPRTSPSGSLEGVLVAGDVNGDGKIDLALAGQSLGGVTTSAALLLGNGDGTFQTPKAVAPYSYSGLTLADINGDGRLDLVVTAFGRGSVQIWLGAGDGTFSVGNTYYVHPIANVGGAVVGDFNNDHKLDLAVGDVFLGNGDGTFQAPPDLPSTDAVVGDFNGDGISDGAIGLNAGFEIYQGSKTGTLTLAQTYNVTGLSTLTAAADLKGDGKLDLVFLPGGVSLSVALGNGDSTFQSPIVSSGCVPTSTYAIADFNNDHKPDFVYLQNDSLYVCLGNGDGSLAASSGGLFVGTHTNSLVAADFNNDGKLDVAVSSDSGLAMLLGNGDATFQPPNYVVQTAGLFFAGADYNGDGNIDLIGCCQSGNTVSTYLGNGDGTFKTPLPQLNLGAVGSSTVADMNGDGKPDLVSFGGDSNGHYLEVNFGNGDGNFGAPIVPTRWNSHGKTPTSILVGDLNGDKLPDVAVPWHDWDGAGSGTAIFLNTTPPVPKLGLVLPQGQTSSQTVSAGGVATYTLSIGGLGWTGQVSLSCAGAPAKAICSFPSGAMMNVSGSSATPLTVTVSTTARNVASQRPNSNRPAPWLWALAIVGLAFLRGAGTIGSKVKPAAFRLAMGLAWFSLLLLSSCGGEGTVTQPAGGTPAGTYPITVTATAGSVVDTVHLTLVVE
jgi:hypothetical protein